MNQCGTPNQWACYGDTCKGQSFLLGSVDGTFAPYTTITSTPLFSSTSTSASTSTSSSQTITSSSVTSSSGSSTITGSAAGAQTSAPTSSSSSSGLSQGAKIGLGVGITFGVIFLGLLGLLIFILMRRNKAAKNVDHSHPPEYPMGSINDQQDKNLLSEYPQQYPQQLPQQQHWNSNSVTPVELDSSFRRELDSTPSNRSHLTDARSPLNSGTGSQSDSRSRNSHLYSSTRS